MPTQEVTDVEDLSRRAQRVVDAAPKRLLIAGRWRPSDGRAPFAVEDPATGTCLCEVADADAPAGEQAVAAASEAQPSWARSAPRTRSELLHRVYERLIASAGDLALLMTLEMGKPLAESRAEIAYAAEFMRWFSEEAVRIDGRVGRAPSGRGRILTTKHPVGPSILITPWNFPMAMGARKVGAAVAAGCTMVVKPAAETPLSTMMLAEMFAEEGLPPGVLNVLTTSTPGELVEPLLVDRRVRKLSFTGSTEVGRRLIAASAPNVLRVSMELGGNAPFLVFGDADLEAAVEGAVAAKMRNGGQACTAANRIYVHRDVAAEFTERLVDRLAGMNVGPGTDSDIDVGPLITSQACDKVDRLVTDAVDRGAETLLGGERHAGPGSFYPPTVLRDVPQGAAILREEIFGPVAPIVTFDDESEAVRMANDTEYGLVAYVFTRDLDRAFTISDELEVGMVGLNEGIVSNPAAPFGGVKHSGFGREGGSEGIEEYLETRYVALNVPERHRQEDPT